MRSIGVASSFDTSQFQKLKNQSNSRNNLPTSMISTRHINTMPRTHDSDDEGAASMKLPRRPSAIHTFASASAPNEDLQPSSELSRLAQRPMERLLETIDDEVDLYHLEVMAPLKARTLSKRAWERLAEREATRLAAYKKWRPFESILTDVDFCLREKRMGNISVRSVRGRDFARPARCDHRGDRSLEPALGRRARRQHVGVLEN